MTSLSRKALRHYHDIGILELAHIDSYTGYRHDTGQVDHAQIYPAILLLAAHLLIICC